jgi:hypothetical protein
MIEAGDSRSGAPFGFKPSQAVEDKWNKRVQVPADDLGYVIAHVRSYGAEEHEAYAADLRFPPKGEGPEPVAEFGTMYGLGGSRYYRTQHRAFVAADNMIRRRLEGRNQRTGRPQ